MKKVLLTNFEMVNYSGSELDTFTMANYFFDHGYDVTIFTLRYNYPLLGDINENIKIINMNNVDLLQKHYDLIWSHHFPLLDYLIFELKITCDYIHYVSLSSFNTYESLPFYYQDLSMVSALSVEALNALKEFKYKTDDINLFTNYTHEKNFSFKTKFSKLRKIAIISNHVPEELIAFSEIAKNNNINVDIYGLGYKYQKVTAELLLKYDLIITIGRTVNDTLAIGIPCYCYDIWGGDGYITRKNVASSYEYNFSGRYSKRKLSGEELYADITNKYHDSISEVDYLKKFAHDHFCFEKMMKSVLKKIYSSKKTKVSQIVDKYPSLKRTAPLFYDKMSALINEVYVHLPSGLFGQLYFDYGSGFNEKDSLKKNYTVRDGKFFINFDIPKGVKNIRFDFSNLKYTIISSMKINGKKIELSELCNCICLSENQYISKNCDPYIYLSDYKKFNAVIEMTCMSYEEIADTYFDSYLKMKKEMELEKQRNDEILNSRSWRIIQKIRKLFRIK